ncbi:hypothetical protein D3C77_452610 [compost metagenome]
MEVTNRPNIVPIMMVHANGCICLKCCFICLNPLVMLLNLQLLEYYCKDKRGK